ncbi:MAG: AmmeMemoRadiSam system radical SAM enzyme [Candidatus Altiarchaeota archaeon]
MREALLYDKVGGGVVKCGLCAQRCRVSDGNRGVCGVRENQGGTLYSLVYGRPVALHVDPIEKKPLFHFHPGSLSYSMATVGCNLRCQHCQNADISQTPKDGGLVPGEDVPPERVVEEALASGCASISYTYTEPTVFMEYALDTSRTAVDKGLKNVFVSNGFMTPESVDLIAPYLHADNVDLKSFSDKFYREVCGGRLEPVLDTLKLLVKKGVWVEVTTLIIPSLNDNVDELGQIAEFIKSELGAHVPWHVSRFHPDYKLNKLPATSSEILRKALEMGEDAGLKYVYAGNIPHDDSENTYCYKCGSLLIERVGFNVLENNIVDSKCSECGAEVHGVGLDYHGETVE